MFRALSHACALGLVLTAGCAPSEDASVKADPTDTQEEALGTGVDSPLVFDPLEYLEMNPDVAAAGVDPRVHWVNYGINEGRRSARYFDVRAYLANYGDLVAAFGSDFRAAVNHYIFYGRGEGRVGVSRAEARAGTRAVLAMPRGDEVVLNNEALVFWRLGRAANAPLSLPWAGADFTGLANPFLEGGFMWGPPQPQRAGWGLSAVIQYAGEFGIAIDSRPVKALHDQFDSTDLYTEVITKQFEPDLRPWVVPGQGIGVHLAIRVPSGRGLDGGRANVVSYLNILDTVSGVSFWYGAQVFDSDAGRIRPWIGVDSCCTKKVIVSTPLGSTTGRLTTLPGSMRTTSTPWRESRHVFYRVTAANLSAAIQNVKSEYPDLRGMSSNPASYVVRSWNLNPEVHIGSGGAGYVGVSGRVVDISVW